MENFNGKGTLNPINTINDVEIFLSRITILETWLDEHEIETYPYGSSGKYRRTKFCGIREELDRLCTTHQVFTLDQWKETNCDGSFQDSDLTRIWLTSQLSSTYSRQRTAEFFISASSIPDLTLLERVLNTNSLRFNSKTNLCLNTNTTNSQLFQT